MSKVTPVFGVTLDTETYMFFQSNTASGIQNFIVCDLFWTRYNFLVQKAPLIIKPVDTRLIILWLPYFWKFDHWKIDGF